MKLRCPRCRQKLSVPDKYAGRAIRCPSCNRAFNVPQAKAAVSGPGAAVDLESMAQLEARSTELSGEELVDAETTEQARKADEAATTAKTRTCPTCHKEVPVKDPYADLLCSHCWNPIPAFIKGSSEVRAKRAAEARRSGGSSDFYGQLTATVTYPLSAIGSIGTAAGIAIAAGILPVAAITGGAYAVAQSAVGTEAGVRQGDLSAAQMILMIVFAVEVIFFSAVALHAFLDVVRTTTVGTERAPNLSWSPTHWGSSFFAYLILCAYVVLMTVLMAKLTISEDPLYHLKRGQFTELAQVGGTKFLLGMAILSFGIPMNLVGMSLGSIAQGLNPTLVGKSILKTHAHYVFLVLIVVVFALLFGTAAMYLVFDWLLPKVQEMIQSAKAGNIGQVALSMLAWGVVMGVFFYGTYVVARLHGLFARAFRKSLFFGTN